jgi:MSHA biogenesis protein MshE
MVRPEKVRLGESLVQQKLISQEQLEFALEQQKLGGRRLGRVLTDNGFATEAQISEALAKQLSIVYINLKLYNLNIAQVRLLPENHARRFRALVLEERNDALLVGMADPTDLPACTELSRILKRDIEVAVVTEGQLLDCIDRGYRRTEEIMDQAPFDDQGVVDFSALANAAGAEDAPLVKFLRSIFDAAMQLRASDIHIEPQENKLMIRLRIDGVLHLQKEADERIAQAMVQRLKLMSGLDISENKLPQDGRFHVRVGVQAVDVRIISCPTQYGEAAVMRLLRQDSGMAQLDQLGMQADLLERLKKILGRRNGMVLFAGPAGSGKTTTGYAALAEINALEQKIITVEDPVEFRLPGINQVQVNEKIGLTFACVLRSALLQDPDVLLIGEMRDAQTAEIGLRAAMSGHQVFAVLHARDAGSALSSLVDMGMPRYRVAASVQAVLAQRLLRRVCESCAQIQLPTPQERQWLEFVGVAPDQRLLHGRGCTQCNGTGYLGRLGVYELLEMGREMADALAHQDSVTQLAHRQMSGKRIIDHALDQMKQGQTTVSEVMRISSQDGCNGIRAKDIFSDL